LLFRLRTALEASLPDRRAFLRRFGEPVGVPHVRSMVVLGIVHLLTGNVDGVRFTRSIDDDLAKNGFNIADTVGGHGCAGEGDWAEGARSLAVALQLQSGL
jgi:hypothetical protein